MSHQITVTRHKVEKSLQKVQQILDNTRNPILAADVSHRYVDKMTLAEFLTKSSVSSVFACLTKLGVTLDQFQTFKQWSSLQAVTLRLHSEEKCRFVRQETREVESKASRVTESSLFGKTTSKVVTTVTDYIWEFNMSYWLEVYRGTGADNSLDCLSILSRTSSCDLVTTSDKSPKVEHRLPPPLEVSLSWLLQRLETSSLSYPLSPQFSINKAAEACFTPRRNPDVEAALFALNGLSRWCQQVHEYFTNSVFSQAPDRGDLDLNVISADSVFVPVLPLLHPSCGTGGVTSQLEQKSDDVVATSSSSLVEDQEDVTLGIRDTNAFLQEQHRTLSAQCEAAAAVLPAGTAHRSLISAAEGTLLVTLLHLVDIARHYEYGVDYIEGLLRDQLISAIGKVIHPKDFSEYMKYHNMKLLKPAYQPHPFCYSVRRSDRHAPEGVVFLEESGGGVEPEQAQPIYTLVSSAPLSRGGQLEKQFTLSASTTVSFTGSTHVHAYMSHRFQNDHIPSQLSLRAEARQFSGFIVLIGSIPTATTFDPQHAFICQNKDEFTIPLDAEMIPSPKAFRDAIESMSPEQQRFAKAFRSMQLASTLFGVLVVQIKPQLEKILNLPPDSLTKEIKLNQDLMELFIKYQIPCDLLSYDTSSLRGGVGADVVSVREKLEMVKSNVAAIHDMIGLTKKQELADRLEEKKYQYRSRVTEDDVFGDMDLCSMAPQPQSSVGGFSFGEGGDGFRATNGGFGGGGFGPPHSSRFGAASGGGASFGFGGGGFGAPPPPPSCAVPVASSQPQQPQMQQQEQQQVQPTPQQSKLESFVSDSPSSSIDKQIQPSQPVKSQWNGGNAIEDCTLLPATLNEKFDELDKDGAVRPVILSVGKDWKKRCQKVLLAAATTATLFAEEQKSEKSAAFDLLDALSRSGGLALDNTDMHMVLMSTHCFDKTLMNTIIQKNTNPIEKMEQSTLVMASVIHNEGVEELVGESQHERLQNQAAMLFVE